MFIYLGRQLCGAQKDHLGACACFFLRFSLVEAEHDTKYPYFEERAIPTDLPNVYINGNTRQIKEFFVAYSVHLHFAFWFTAPGHL